MVAELKAALAAKNTAKREKPQEEFADLREHFMLLRLSAFNAPALPQGDLATALDLPDSTLEKLCAQGRGPRRFKLGRRWYIYREDTLAWLAEMAKAEE